MQATAKDAEVVSQPADASSELRSCALLNSKLFQTHVGKLFIRHHKQVTSFFAPVISGVAAAFVLYLLDLVRGTANAKESIAFKFCEGVISHFDPVLVILGGFLACLCSSLIGSPLARGVQHLVVLPIIRLGHHVVLVGAGALIALGVASVVSPDASARTTAFLFFGVIVLMLGGAELQFAKTVAAMKEEAIRKHMPIWVFAVINVAMTLMTGYFLVKQLAHGH